MAALSGTIAAIRRRRRRKASGALNAIALIGTSFLGERERLQDKKAAAEKDAEDRRFKLRKLDLEERGLDERAADRRAARENAQLAAGVDILEEGGRNRRADQTSADKKADREQRIAEHELDVAEFEFEKNNPKGRKLTQKQQEAEDWIQTISSGNLDPIALGVLTGVFDKHNITEKWKLFGDRDLTAQDISKLGLAFLKDFNKALEEIQAPQGAVEDVRFKPEILNAVRRAHGGLASPIFGIEEDDLSNEGLLGEE